MNKSHIAAFGYSLFVGLSFLMTKLVVPYASPLLILAHRFTISLVVFSIFIVLWKKKIKLTVEKILSILPITLFYPLLFFALQVYGLRTVSSSEGGIIFATVPILTLILLSIFGVKPSKIQTLCMILSVTGVILIFSRDLSSLSGDLIGIGLLFLSALSFSMYTIVVKRIVKVVTIYELTFMILLIGFLVFNFMTFSQLSIEKEGLIHYMLPFKTPDYSMGILYLGIFASVVASFSSNYALKYLTAAQFSVFSNLSTLISILAGAIILKEPLSASHYMGISLILLGVIGTNFSQK